MLANELFLDVTLIGSVGLTAATAMVVRADAITLDHFPASVTLTLTMSL